LVGEAYEEGFGEIQATSKVGFLLFAYRKSWSFKGYQRLVRVVMGFNLVIARKFLPKSG
jgi:hypothetical protein